MLFKNDNPLSKYDNVHIDENGYLRNSITNRLVHREIMEIELDRKLKWWEVVHHIDGDKLNNDADNLWVCSPYSHSRIHKTNLVRRSSWI